MSLPKIGVPEYTITLPLSNQTIRIRSYLSKEEKILLMAKESGKEDDMVNAIKQLVRNCVLSDIDCDNIPNVDWEYLFIQLRKYSVGEDVDLKLENENCKKDDCPKHVDIKFPIDSIHLKNSNQTKDDFKIQINEKVGVVLKPLTFGEINSSSKGNTEIDRVFDMIIKMIDHIYDETEIYRAKDYTHEELLEFVESFDKKTMTKIQEYIDKLPYLSAEISFSCPNCQKTNKKEIRGLANFFT